MGKTPKEIIERLMLVQAREFTYEEFMIVLKNRLRRFHGRDEIMFFNESQIVDLLHIETACEMEFRPFK
jgi:hypothetical protein